MSVIVAVTFDEGSSSKRYEYLYEGDKRPEVGDKAVVYVSNSWSNENYKITTIRSVHSENEKSFPYSLKKVVEIISLAEKRREAEREKRRAELKRELTKRLKAQSELFMFERLAQEDPAARRLLDELKALG